MKIALKNANYEVVESYDCNNYNFPDVQFKKGNKKKTGFYCTVPMTYDIETTSYQGIRNEDNDEWIEEPFGIMYHWQVCFNGDIIMGRTWEEFCTFINRMISKYNLNQDRHVIVYSHNLGFEWQNSQCFLGAWNNMFAVKTRTPLCVRLYNGLELRCSWKLSNMSLEKFCESTKSQYTKASGDLDYNVWRTPSTPLTWDERGYCASDVKSLYHAIIAKMEEEGDDLEHIPLTSTGYVRRHVREYCNNDKNYRSNFLKNRLELKSYKLLRRAASGGDTHANRYLSNKLQYNCDSYDVLSSYPYVMMTKLYPITKFQYFGKITSKKQFDYCLDNYACVFKILFEDLSIKDDCIDPILSSSKCHIPKDADVTYDNGRILYCSTCITYLTDIDYKEIKKYYNAKSIKVSDMHVAKYGRLPRPIRDAVKDLFVEKCELSYKRDLYEPETEEYINYDYYYNKCKNKLNGIFGMLFTDPVRATIIENDDYSWEEEKINIFLENDENDSVIEAALNDFYKHRNNFVNFAWGVWTTSHARAHLHRLIDIATSDGGMGVYWDTDSIKGFMLNHDAIERKNKEIIEECINSDAYYKYEDKCYYLGIYEKENPMNRFITMGAKKYAYEDAKGKLHLTLSGVNKAKGATELGKIENFRTGFVFKDAASMKMYYNDNNLGKININGEEITIGTSCSLLPNTYTLGLSDDYEKLLYEMEI